MSVLAAANNRRINLVVFGAVTSPTVAKYLYCRVGQVKVNVILIPHGGYYTCYNNGT